MQGLRDNGQNLKRNSRGLSWLTSKRLAPQAGVCLFPSSFSIGGLAVNKTLRTPIRRLLDVHQVAEALHLSVRAIYSRVNRGFFPDGVLVKLGEGTLRFDAEKLEDFLKKREVTK
jgi:predicted DNA-binding transcriptional regulator AlpA